MLYVRQYQTTDHEAVCALHHLALETVGVHLGSGPWDDDLDHIEAVYLQSGGTFLVGLCAEQVVAMGALKPLAVGQAEIKRMRVHPAFQRRGFGQFILTALEQRAEELGFTHLQLDTSMQQVAAQGLYLKNGYVEIRRAQLHKRLDCIFYEKKLNTHAP